MAALLRRTLSGQVPERQVLLSEVLLIGREIRANISRLCAAVIAFA
jgi:hypothetical protein